MSDIIANYVESMEETLTSLTRNLASWRSFATDSRELPIVTYLASVNGVKSLEVASDLSKLPVGDAETVKAILAQHHGAQVLRALELVELTAEKFKDHLTSPQSEKADTAVLGEDIPEADYPEGNHGNDDFE